MITKDELQKYVSIKDEIPDECGEMEDGRYNTRYIGEWGVYAFCYLPKALADNLVSKLITARKNDKPFCRKLSFEYHGDHRFICTLNEGHDGLCVAGAHNDGKEYISGIFEPDKEADHIEYVADKMVSMLLRKILEK